MNQIDLRRSTVSLVRAETPELLHISYPIARAATGQFNRSWKILIFLRTGVANTKKIMVLNTVLVTNSVF